MNNTHSGASHPYATTAAGASSSAASSSTPAVPTPPVAGATAFARAASYTPVNSLTFSQANNIVPPQNYQSEIDVNRQQSLIHASTLPGVLPSSAAASPTRAQPY